MCIRDSPRRPRSRSRASRSPRSVCQTGLEPRTSRPQPGGSATHMLEPRLGQVLWTRPRTRTRPSPRRRSSRPGRRRSSRPSARRRPPLPRPLPTVARADGRGLTAREFQGASSAPRDYRKPEPRGGRGSVDLEGVGLRAPCLRCERRTDVRVCVECVSYRFNKKFTPGRTFTA